MSDTDPGGRIYFSSIGRSLIGEDEIVVLSVGVDIGSSTSHLVFSRIVLERLDSRYVVSSRERFFDSEILFTPYASDQEIDAQALGSFLERQYQIADVDPDEIDTGALILTGVAVQRCNARRIADLFARQAGKMVAVSAGDSLEAVMAAHGSGAVAWSIRERASIMNVDIGGGTTKIAICTDGRVTDVTAVDAGARLICLDPGGGIVRIEEAGRRFGVELGIDLEPGSQLAPQCAGALAACMADRVFKAMAGGSPVAGGRELLRLPPLPPCGGVDLVMFSGGVSEYIYGRGTHSHCDLGFLLAQEIRGRIARWKFALCRSNEGIRATAIGASQYTIQVSGSTIYVSPLEALPLRNVPVVAPAFALQRDSIDPVSIAAAIQTNVHRLDLGRADTPVALFVPWRGSATFQRLDDFCRGVVNGLAELLTRGYPLVLAGDGDIGGLLGIHLREEMGLANAIVSVDGIELKEFDYIDIGAMLPNSGAVPVAIKSLIFPTDSAPAAGRPSQLRTLEQR
jgi:ethanolamine utilization protein EutA